MPRCKNCKEKFEPSVFNQKYCFKDECVRAFNEATWTKRKAKVKKELLTVQDHMKLAQAAFNAYIRERDKGKECISCGCVLKGKYDASHYYSAGGHWALRFDERNVHGACVYCNQHLHGNLHGFRKGILKRLGERSLTELDNLSQQTRKFTVDDLKQITKHYREKLKELETKNRANESR